MAFFHLFPKTSGSRVCGFTVFRSLVLFSFTLPYPARPPPLPLSALRMALVRNALKAKRRRAVFFLFSTRATLKRGGRLEYKRLGWDGEAWWQRIAVSAPKSRGEATRNSSKRGPVSSLEGAYSRELWERRRNELREPPARGAFSSFRVLAISPLSNKPGFLRFALRSVGTSLSNTRRSFWLRKKIKVEYFFRFETSNFPFENARRFHPFFVLSFFFRSKNL